ncbi:MAG TPA: site-2 protease family protein, partial [Chthoniobacterales bacterium]|nr:site-2 protease family protein [Chthoniobacterales bacterium]
MRDSIRLFRFAGIEVALHFTWFLAAAYFLTTRTHSYRAPVFALYEYIALFVIVLLHEFGHAFACRQVGGMANYILLWPFGGVAFVRPPARPGAQLWSIAAGPLVNVALVPVLLGVRLFAVQSGLAFQMPDTYRLISNISWINLALLIFNLLPIYPLDGGQILRSLLWFPLGRIRSLQIASITGLIGGAVVVLWAIRAGSIWIVVLAVFLLSQAIAGWRQAQALRLEEQEATRVESQPSQPPRPPVL